MALDITDQTTYVKLSFGTNRAESIPKNNVVLSRDGDEFFIKTATDLDEVLARFDVGDVTTPTPAETLATGSVELTGGASGSVDSITVNGVNIMSSAVNFNSSLIQTAADVASNINGNTSSPNYTASNGGTTTVTITAVADSGNTPNGFVVTSATTTITTTDTNMSGGISKADDLETDLQGYLFTAQA
jgi:hypothetical protein